MQRLHASMISALFGLALLPATAALAVDQHHPQDNTQSPSPSPSPKEPSAGQVAGAPMAMMPMMSMMGQGGMGMMGMGGADPTGMPGMVDHVEGRIAFLRAELAITDAQAQQWNEFADALRATAKSHNDGRAAGMQKAAATSLAARLEQQEQALNVRLDGVRTLGAALKKLAAVLDETQKKSLDELTAMQFGQMMMM